MNIKNTFLWSLALVVTIFYAASVLSFIVSDNQQGLFSALLAGGIILSVFITLGKVACRQKFIFSDFVFFVAILVLFCSIGLALCHNRFILCLFLFFTFVYDTASVVSVAPMIFLRKSV